MELETRPDAATGSGEAGDGDRGSNTRPTAIEVRGVEKSFQLPTQRVNRLKERLVRPFARQEYRRLDVLREIDFDIRQGEFFGIVGRNGSGKSTLLKIMASIYQADSGRVRMAGSVAPFIELGVGFDMELSARDNVVLNGVMMGLSPKEARRRLGAVLEFAELEDFVEVKLKNYSSGMLVRLGFSTMIQADTDIVLIDEVLAVGDAAFQQKCADVFHDMRGSGKTIVLVTHDMVAVEHFCHRAMLLSEGRIVELGDPGEVARRYLRLNFESGFEPAKGEIPDQGADLKLLDVWLENEGGERISNAEKGIGIRMRAMLEARTELSDPQFSFVVANEEDVYVHHVEGQIVDADGKAGLRAGERATVTVELQNRLRPGRYFLHHGAGDRTASRNGAGLWVPHALAFIVFSDDPNKGLIAPDHRVVVERGGEAGQ